MAKATQSNPDSKAVNEIADKVFPLLDGYSGNEIAHAFYLLMFRLGMHIAADEQPVVVVVAEPKIGMNAQTKEKKESVN